MAASRVAAAFAPPHPPPPRSYMHELPYGGWVAPGIFYLGYSGCIVVAGLRIAGLANLAAPPLPPLLLHHPPALLIACRMERHF